MSIQLTGPGQRIAAPSGPGSCATSARSRRRLAGLLLAAACAMPLGATPVLAQAPDAGAAGSSDQPYVFPRDDVTVVYRSEGAPGSGTMANQTLRVSAALGKQRVDAPGGGMSMITDSVGRTTTLLDHARHGYVVLPAPPGTADMRGRRAPGDYVRVGSATVAGLPCTLWSTRDPRGQPIQVCITADGVLLQASSGNQVLAEAVRVDHAPIPASVFEPPAGYTKLPPPPAPGGPPAP